MYDCWGGLINQLSSSIDIIGGLHCVISKVNFNAVYSEKNSWSHFGLFVTELSRFRTRLVRHTTSSVYVNFFFFTIGQFVLSRVTLSKGEPYLNPKDSSNQKEKKMVKLLSKLRWVSLRREYYFLLIQVLHQLNI